MTRSRKALTSAIFLALALFTCAYAGQVEPETIYYAIEINGVLCGYSELKTSALEQDGKRLVLLEHRVEQERMIVEVGRETRVAILVAGQQATITHEIVLQEVDRSGGRIDQFRAVQAATGDREPTNCQRIPGC